MIGDAVALALLLATLGCHSLWPWRLARSEAARRRRWSLAAAPLLLAAALASLLALGANPDLALAWGLTPTAGESLLARAVAVLFFALVAVDLLLLAAPDRSESSIWRIASGFGLATLLAATWASELLARTETPRTLSLAGAVAARALLGLAFAESVGRPRQWTRAAAVLLAAHFATQPAAVRATLVATLEAATAAIAALLLLAAPHLPARLQRLAAWAGFALAVLYLARVGELARLLPQGPALDLG